MSALVYVVPSDALVVGRVTVDGAEGRHAAVLRMAVGEPVLLVDGVGGHGFGRVVAAHHDRLEVEVPAIRHEPPPSPRFVVVQALPKGDRGEVAVETLTEVGADVVVPWAAARCVTRWRDGRGEKALARWRTSAWSAGKQARRTRFPEVTALSTTADVAQLLAGAAAGVVLHEEAAGPLAGLAVPPAGDVVVVVGPEGGLAAEEVALFEAAGARTYRLGDTVLRTSTAGTAALAVLLSRTRWR